LAITFSPPGLLSSHQDTGLAIDEDVRLATDGVGNWLAVWESEYDLGGTIGTDRDILAAQSQDDGITWSDPIVVNSTAYSDGSSSTDNSPGIASAGNGNWVVAWHWSEPGIGDEAFVARSTDNGATWTQPAPLDGSPDDQSDIYSDIAGYQVATDDSGLVAIACTSRGDLGGTIGTDGDILVYRSMDYGATWLAPVPVNNDAATDSDWDRYPNLFIDTAGHWMVAWSRGRPNTEFLSTVSLDGGESWSDPVDVGDGTAPYIMSGIAGDGDGRWVAAWSHSSYVTGNFLPEFQLFVSRSENDGATWSTPTELQMIVDSNAHMSDPRVVTDGAGHWVVIWSADQSGANPNIYATESVDDGETWSAVELVQSYMYDISYWDLIPDLATDGLGTWVAVWSTDNPLTGLIL